jgi:hypothetical protein
LSLPPLGMPSLTFPLALYFSLSPLLCNKGKNSLCVNGFTRKSQINSL